MLERSTAIPLSSKALS
jgi:hypothetical protein